VVVVVSGGEEVATDEADDDCGEPTDADAGAVGDSAVSMVMNWDSAARVRVVTMSRSCLP